MIWRRLIVFGLIIAIAGCARDGNSFLHPHGLVAATQRRWLFEIVGLMLLIILPVFVCVPLFAWRYRRTNLSATYKKQWDFSWPIEFFVWGAPIAIVVFLAIIVMPEETRFDPYRPLASDQKPLEVEVVALNWKWLFIYPEQHVATVGVLTIPQDRPVHFRLTSDATMQSFFIPALGSQIYAMAGMTTQLNLIADRPGNLLGKNTQFNGIDFTQNTFTASVLPPDDFTSWSNQTRQTAPPFTDTVYKTLSQDSTLFQAKLAFKIDENQPLAFSDVPDGFFYAIVKKYDAGMDHDDGPGSSMKEMK